MSWVCFFDLAVLQSESHCGDASPKPDADFSLLALDGRGMQKRLRLRSSVLLEDDSHARTRGSLGSGLFRSLRGVLGDCEIIFRHVRDEDFLVVSPITFEACFDNFPQLAKKLFESWHLC